MQYTSHAIDRMNERSITRTMLDDTMVFFFRFGSWNDRADRLTLRTDTEEMHRLIACKSKHLHHIKRYLARKRTETSLSAQNCRTAIIKALYKRLQRQLRSLKKMEHKKEVTLVICGEKILTVYRTEKRHLRDTVKFDHRKQNSAVLLL